MAAYLTHGFHTRSEDQSQRRGKGMFLDPHSQLPLKLTPRYVVPRRAEETL